MRGPARRESDTMDTFMCSSWYQMRYADPHNPERPVSREAAAKWLPVDQYTGGAEHAVMHLLYTRFFWKAARDMGVVEGDEPMLRLFNQGVILGPDGNRMSKSRGNVVAPDDQVSQWGSDAFRCQLMFVGPWDQGGPYNPTGMAGIVRWLNRLWSLGDGAHRPARRPPSEGTRDLRRATHKTISRPRRRSRLPLQYPDLAPDGARFGDAEAREAGPVDHVAWEEAVTSAILATAPLAPHLAEELWDRIGGAFSVHTGMAESVTPSWLAMTRLKSRFRSTARCGHALVLPVRRSRCA
ncbi:MAG: class I tRNA ligase family protein [Dehalococcoidia bacterium]|uniref:class I tRNA ligase family protein n=1 Tax=Candidatus Amarobacter glycogenicus TaxID=3140699 RepID=UPI0031347D88|nr:class I tRNA ligase family protein [Dehalococcoidia bacterium]